MSLLGRGRGAVRWLGSFARLSLGVSSCAESVRGKAAVRFEPNRSLSVSWLDGQAALAVSDAVVSTASGAPLRRTGTRVIAAKSSQRPGAAYVFVEAEAPGPSRRS